jgi:ferric-dicitrate binding protein FerR (iron transport regulator)
LGSANLSILQVPVIMNPQQVSFFAERYSRMSDEELSYLIATRGGSLSEEAQTALEAVIAKRNPAAFQREFQATSADVSSQLAHTQREAERRAERDRNLRNAVRLTCFLLVIVGLLGAMMGDSGYWLSLSGMGAALFVNLELRRIVGRFFAAVFRMN